MNSSRGSSSSVVERLKLDFIVIGNQNAGKTSLIKSFALGDGSFTNSYTPTIGMSLDKKMVKIGNTSVSLFIWDTAGQEKFFALTKAYFKKADGVLIVFDLTSRASFERIEKYWMEQIKEKSDEDCVKVLVGNKVDMGDREVKFAEAKQLAEKFGIQYFETSAKTRYHVEETFMSLATRCTHKLKEEEGSNIDLKKPAPTNQGCMFSVKNFFDKLFGGSK